MELSDEEKKAIELLKKLQKKTPYIIWGDGTPYNKNNQIQTILNLIEKLQKEIEERETRLQEEINENCKLKTELYGNSISKDKIRELREIDNIDLIQFKIKKLLKDN